jgi:hypothetical protein
MIPTSVALNMVTPLRGWKEQGVCQTALNDKQTMKVWYESREESRANDFIGAWK